MKSFSVGTKVCHISIITRYESEISPSSCHSDNSLNGIWNYTLEVTKTYGVVGSKLGSDMCVTYTGGKGKHGSSGCRYARKHLEAHIEYTRDSVGILVKLDDIEKGLKEVKLLYVKYLTEQLVNINNQILTVLKK